MSDEVKKDEEFEIEKDDTEPTKEPKKEDDLSWQQKIEQEIQDLKNLFKTKEPENQQEIPVPKPPQKEPEPEPEPEPQQEPTKKRGFLDWLL